jgi:hypothetical protein
MGWTVGDRIPAQGVIFRTRRDLSWDQPNLLHDEYGVISGGKAAGGVALITHLHVVPTLKKEYSYTFALPLGLNGLLSAEMYFKKSRNMLYSVTHTATPLHVLRSSTSPNVLLSSHLYFQFKTHLHRHSDHRHELQLRYIFETCTSHQCCQYKEMNCLHSGRVLKYVL